ncbi:hypothetical protein V500_07602 [Pseudogymnoascus sp. VKM F-4518 (FW-2643)]|nr:hypothetical protein V500_07602 [Pseudogymnoascus sp. VKM F-4518 (FW-2643)]
MEGTPLSEACKWLLENPSESIDVASRIFKIHRSTIRSSINRSARQKKPRGGKNKVLSTAQTEALKAWILEQYHLGLGANRHMVYAAVCHLRSPLPPPSQSWLTKYIRSELLEFHFITTKPIAQQRTQAQKEPPIIKWFKEYTELILQRSINLESIWNMDETGFRVGIPGGERVMVPRAVKQLYTPSPENRISITIIEAVSARGQEIAPVLVVPGKIHMESWYPENLGGNELILLSETGYSNSQLALRWLQHFIELTAPHDPGNPKVLLLDSHVSHTSPEFVIMAAKYHIILWAFPSHLTHVLQPLDVGIFQPYKHWHRQAVLRAIREVDITYNLPLFMRDFPQIRERTFKESTIQSAFQKAGIWPISCNTALEKLRTYSKPRQPTQPTTPTLPRPITPIPSTFQDVEQGLQRWKERVPEAFSSPSRQSYGNWLTGAARVLAAGQLQELDLQAIRQQVKNSKKKRPGRGQLQRGGELRASEAHELQAQKAELQAQKLAATEARKLSQATNQARKQLRRAGIEARKQERLRKKSVAQLTKLGLPIPPELEDPITDPEADSESEYESASEGGRGSRRWSGSESGNEEVIIS